MRALDRIFIFLSLTLTSNPVYSDPW